MKERDVKVNRAAMERNSFFLRAAWYWVQKNHPHIEAAIRAEGQKRWPSARGKSKHDKYLAFLESENGGA